MHTNGGVVPPPNFQKCHYSAKMNFFRNFLRDMCMNFYKHVTTPIFFGMANCKCRYAGFHGEVEAPPIGTGCIMRAYGEYLRDFIKQYGCIHDQIQSSLQRHTHKFTYKDRHTLRHAHSRRETRIRLRPRITHKNTH